MGISLPKNFNNCKTIEDIKRALQEFVYNLETQVNTPNQIFIYGYRQKINERQFRRKDIIFRIEKLEGDDILKLYWFDGKRLQSLQFGALTGTVPASSIEDSSSSDTGHCCEILVSDDLPLTMLTNEDETDYLYSD